MNTPAPPKQWAAEEAATVLEAINEGYPEAEVFVHIGYGYYDDAVIAFARALEAAYQRGRDEGLEDAAETNLRCVWNEDDIPEKFFPDGYEDGWIDATEECARRIRGLKSERGAGSMPYERVER